MIKKMILGTLLVGLIGVLVVGGINRTVDRTAKTLASHAEGNGEQGNGHQNYEDEGTPGEPGGLGQAQVEGWEQHHAAVTRVNDEALIVETDKGYEIVIQGRPWRFAQEQLFAVQVGDAVTLTGFYEGEEFEVGRIENTANGQSVWIRDESGRPMWAGRGRQGG